MVKTYFLQLFHILRQPFYGVLATVLAWSLFSLVMWLPNLSVILTIWHSSTAVWTEKITILWSFYGSLFTNFNSISGSYIVATAILFGVNSSVLVFYVQKIQAASAGVVKSQTVGLLGMLSAALGIGCAACGSLVLMSLLALVGAGGVLTLFPFGGAEFGIVGVVLLLYSLHLLLQKITQPLVCPIVE